MFMPDIFVTISLYFGIAIVSGTFRWTEKKNVLLLREVRVEQPFLYKTGSKETGRKWTSVAAILNKHHDFCDNPRDQRSVRERFQRFHI